MSVVGAASVPATRAESGPLARYRVATLPVRAFVASRLLALATGAIGVLTMAKHSATAATAVHTNLGPAGSVLAGSVDRFDSSFYLDIAAHGYGTASAGRLAFFPLYPLLIRLLEPLTGSWELAGFLISAAALLGALVLLHRLTELELGRRAADATILLLAFAPLSFFFTAIYTESLFLALTVASVYAARTDRWRLACGLGALATLTRPTGILLAVALVLVRVRARGGPDRSLAWALALPAALLGYLACLAVSGYSWLAPFQAEAGWQRVTVGPIVGLASAIWSALRGAARIAGGGSVYHPGLLGPFSQGAESVILLGGLALVIAGTAIALRRLPLAYGVYAALAIVLCLSSPDAGQPLWSLDRYALTLFPLWMAAGAWVAARRLERPAVAIGAVLLVFYTLQFSSWAFVA